jgi:CBS domain-containing protein
LKTSAILYRVADFLKSHPPFCHLDDSTLESVSASGRVRFHERDEILFSAGDSYDRYLLVIQQGSVQLARPEKDRSHVVDLLGVGDVVGLGRFAGRTTHEHTATTLGETVIYALDFKAFSEACANAPRASHFLQSHFAAARTGLILDETADESSSKTAEEILRNRFIYCAPEMSLREAAVLMQGGALEELLVIDPEQKLVGCLTLFDLRDAIADGRLPAETPVSGLMRPIPPVIEKKSTVRDCLRALMRSGARHLCVTLDGKPGSSALGLLSERDLLPWHGNNPALVINAMRETREVKKLAHLRSRIDDLIRAGLTSFQNAEWIGEIVTESNRALASQLSRLSAEETASVLGRAAPCEFCLGFIGAAGRGERLTPGGLEMILLQETGGADAETWFTRFAEILENHFLNCGFSTPVTGLIPRNRECRGDMNQWRDRFREWIQSPIEINIGTRLSFFDFSPVQPDHFLSNCLRKFLRESLFQHPNFIRLLANDCFENLPPLTIFEGYAVDAEGFRAEELDLQAHALQPVADVARVFQLATGDATVTSTLERLAGAEKSNPAASAIFQQAARAFRIALTRGALVGLKMGSDGSRIRPAQLSRSDQLLLKSGFQSIADLLEHAARSHGFHP